MCNFILLGHSPPASLAGRRDGLKLGLMGTYGVQILPWLVRWTCAGTRDFYTSLTAKYFFRRCALFQFMCPHRPATLAGSRAGPPVSECVSPGNTKDYTSLAAVICKSWERRLIVQIVLYRIIYVHSLIQTGSLVI